MNGPRMGIFGDPTKIGQRDAMHVPVVLVTADQTMAAGDSVVFLSPTTVRHWSITAGEEIQAKVDPWLKSQVNPGLPFYVMVSPDLVGDLTHHFQIKGLTEAKTPTADEIKKAVDDARTQWEEDYPCRDCY